MLYLLWDVHESLIPWVAVSRCSCWDPEALHYLFQDKIMLVAPTNVLFFLHSNDLVDFNNWKKGSIGVWAPIQSLVKLREGMSV